jgi:galactokinase
MKVCSLPDIEEEFEERFATPPLLVKGSGRINIIGEHTDYNDGLVLPASIDRHIYFALAENGTTDCHFVAANLDISYSFSLEELKKSEHQWANYMIGILAQLREREVPLEGINLVFGGNLPVGSGLSSSAALECGFALGICSLFNLQMSRQKLAQLCQQSSNNFMGIPSGIMDQFASLLGQAGQAIKLDCRDLTYEYIPLDTGPYTLVLINSTISHDHASSAYAERVEECNRGVALLQQQGYSIKSLREVPPQMLEKHRTELGELIYKRCAYVVSENQRVEIACNLLKNGAIKKLGALLYKTHEGLSKAYEVSCPEIDFLVDFAKRSKGVVGARLMGGGFGGCTLNLVHQNHKETFIRQITQAYQEEWGIDAEVYEVAIEDGTNTIR